MIVRFASFSFCHILAKPRYSQPNISNHGRVQRPNVSPPPPVRQPYSPPITQPYTQSYSPTTKQPNTQPYFKVQQQASSSIILIPFPSPILIFAVSLTFTAFLASMPLIWTFPRKENLTNTREKRIGGRGDQADIGKR